MAGRNRSNLDTVSTRPDRLAALSQARQAWTHAGDPVARLYRRVSMTLSLEHLLGVFAEELGSVLPFGQLVYRHRLGHQDFVYTTGLGGAHRCDYQLTLEGENYGSLALTRRERFSDEELEAIEFLLGILICPLRNACQYALVEQAALTDSLTEIPNKRALDMDLVRDCSLGDRHGDTFTLILCDLDHFKTINDTYGHVVGDHILKAMAKALREATRDGDSIFRFGGEEFAIVLPHTGSHFGQRIADRIRTAVHEIRVACGATQVRVTASAGVATRRKGEMPDQWLARADDALYRAKDAGRNCTRIAHSIEEKTEIFR